MRLSCRNQHLWPLHKKGHHCMLMELEHITTILLRVEDPLPELEFQY
jgi:hypothetical protein